MIRYLLVLGLAVTLSVHAIDLKNLENLQASEPKSLEEKAQEADEPKALEENVKVIDLGNNTKAVCYGQFSDNYSGNRFQNCYFFTGRVRSNLADAVADCQNIFYSSGLVQPKTILGRDDLYLLYKSLPSTVFYYWVR
jgi:hypothetical protein